MKKRGSFTTTALLLLSCGGNVTPSDVCGTGTHDENGRCVSNGPHDVTCGPYTHLERDECVPNGRAADASANDSSSIDDASNIDAGTDADTIDVDAACLATGNTFVIAGNSYIHSGPPLIIHGVAGWQVEILQTTNGQPSYIRVRVGQNWSAEFSTSALGKPLLPGLYTNTEYAARVDPGHPGLDIGGPGGSGCPTASGQFRIIEMMASASDAGMPILKSFTVTYEQQCATSQDGPNVGCLSVTQ